MSAERITMAALPRRTGWSRRTALRGAGGLGLATLLAGRSTRAERAEATATAGEAPNLFVLAGEAIAITYSTSSLDGQPRLSFRDGTRDLSFAGEELRAEASEIGRLVTVSLEAVPDLSELTLTLLVPAINLPADESELPIALPAVLTTHRSSVGGPNAVEGVVQTYEVVLLEGTASLVDF